MYKFDSNTLSFYPHSMEESYKLSGTWPINGTDVSDYVYADFKLTDPPYGMQLGADGLGNPCWVPVPPPTPEEIFTQTEAKRKSLIAQVDSVSVIAWNSMEPELQAEWVAYRKELVALPKQPGYPSDVQWPTKPEMPE